MKRTRTNWRDLPAKKRIPTASFREYARCLELIADRIMRQGNLNNVPDFLHVETELIPILAGAPVFVVHSITNRNMEKERKRKECQVHGHLGPAIRPDGRIFCGYCESEIDSIYA